MSSTINLLLTAAGTQTFSNFVTGVKKGSNRRLRIVACDIDRLAYGLYLADKAYLIPKASSPEFIPTLLEICKKEKIDVLVPLLSLEYPKVSRAKKKFNKIGVSVPISDFSTVRKAIDKKLTYDFFIKNEIPTPASYLPKEIPKKLSYPLIIKPRKLSGSKSIYKVNSRHEISHYLKLVPNPIIQEFIEGQEYTVDTLSYWDSTPIAIVPRVRIQTMDGKSVKGKTVDEPGLVSLVQTIIRKLKLIGPSNIQCFKVGDEYFFTEINPRFSAGGLPLAIEAGVNTPLLLVQMALGKKVFGPLSYKKDLYMLRYFTELFVKEDQLIKDGT